jgi:hypothetical protein
MTGPSEQLIVAEPAPAETLPTPVLERLHALVRKGYKPVIGADPATDRIVLRHLGKAPDLVLRADGTVAPFDGRWPRHKRKVAAPAPFAPGKVTEQLRFLQFLDSVPKASLRDRTRPWRHKYVYLPIVGTFLVGIHLAFTAAIMGG